MRSPGFLSLYALGKKIKRIRLPLLYLMQGDAMTGFHVTVARVCSFKYQMPANRRKFAQ